MSEEYICVNCSYTSSDKKFFNVLYGYEPEIENKYVLTKYYKCCTCEGYDYEKFCEEDIYGKIGQIYKSVFSELMPKIHVMFEKIEQLNTKIENLELKLNKS